MEIIQAVSNEVDEGLKDDIDDEMEGEDSEENEELKQSKIREIPSEGIFQRIEPWVKNMLKKNSFNNYRHYFGSYSAGMTNLFVVIAFWASNLSLLRTSIEKYLFTCVFVLFLDYRSKKKLREFIGKIVFKIFRYKTDFEFLEDKPIPHKMEKPIYDNYISEDLYLTNGFIYFLLLQIWFIYTFLGHLFIFKLYESLFESLLSFSDTINFEIHFLRFVYYEMAESSFESITYIDITIMTTIILPFILWILEFLTIPSHIKDNEYEGRFVIFWTPLFCISLFLYDSSCILWITLILIVFALLNLRYIALQAADKKEQKFKQRWGIHYERIKRDRELAILEQMKIKFGKSSDNSTNE